MRVLFAGGGTAGHINPAIAIANTIKLHQHDAEIRFIGTSRGMENDLVKKAGYPLYHIDVKGFQRKELLKNFDTVRCLWKSLGQSKKILDEFKPDLVIGTGGYVSGPVLYEAAKRHIKTAIHEQNAFPGVTSKILQHYVDKVMISFEESRHYFKEKDKIVFTGNPVRSEFFHMDQKKARQELGIDDSPFVFSVGGSLGAYQINCNIIDFMKENSKTNCFWHFHGAGSAGYKMMSQKLKEANVDLEKHPKIKVQEYIYNMPVVMAACDLMVCRCGAITLSEIEALGKPAILIPSPNVTGNHQYFNAMALVNQNAAVILEEKDLTPDKLTALITELLMDQKRRTVMGKNARAMSADHCSEKIYHIVNGI